MGFLLCAFVQSARGPPLWDECDAQMGDGVDVEPDWDHTAQQASELEVDQRIIWLGAIVVLPTLRGRLRPSPPKPGHTEKLGRLAQRNHLSRPQYAGL